MAGEQFGLEITVDKDLHKIAVAFASGGQVMREEMKASLNIIGQGMQNYVVTHKLRGGVLQRRTGTLGSAVFYRVDDDGQADGTISCVVTADLGIAIYARVQELGGTITAKNGGYLTIPLEAALTGAGVARFSAHEVIANPQAFGFDGTFFAKHVLFGKQGDTIVPLFALKTSVTLKPAGYLSSSFDERTGWIGDQLEQGAARAAQRLADAAE